MVRSQRYNGRGRARTFGDRSCCACDAIRLNVGLSVIALTLQGHQHERLRECSSRLICKRDLMAGLCGPEQGVDEPSGHGSHHQRAELCGLMKL